MAGARPIDEETRMCLEAACGRLEERKSADSRPFWHGRVTGFEVEKALNSYHM